MKQEIIDALIYNAGLMENIHDDVLTNEDLDKIAILSDSIADVIQARGIISAINGAIKRCEE